MRYTYEPKPESKYRVRTLELANESYNLEMKIIQQKKIWEAYKNGTLITLGFLILLIVGAIFSPILNP